MVVIQTTRPHHSVGDANLNATNDEEDTGEQRHGKHNPIGPLRNVDLTVDCDTHKNKLLAAQVGENTSRVVVRLD